MTLPSHASILTGLYPTKHQVRDTGGFVLPSSCATLATVMQRLLRQAIDMKDENDLTV